MTNTKYNPLQVQKYSSISEMLRNQHFQFMAVEGGSTHEMLKSFNDPFHIEILQRMNANKDASWKRSYTESFQELLQGNKTDVGIVIEGQAATYFTSRHCNLYSVGSLTDSFYALGFRKGSLLVETLSEKLLELKELGRLRALKKKWFGPSVEHKQQCGLVHNREHNYPTLVPSPLGVNYFASPIFFLIIIVALAVIFALLELAYNVCSSSGEEVDSVPGANNPFVKRPSKKNKYGKEVKVACCGCFPVAKADQDD